MNATAYSVGQTSNAPSAVKISEIERELNRHGSAVELLASVIESLERRLSPVTRPMAGEVSAAASPEAVCNSAVGAQLRTQSQNIEASTERLRTLLEALCI
jgi:hypothetical protein